MENAGQRTKKHLSRINELVAQGHLHFASEGEESRFKNVVISTIIDGSDLNDAQLIQLKEKADTYESKRPL